MSQPTKSRGHALKRMTMDYPVEVLKPPHAKADKPVEVPPAPKP